MDYESSGAGLALIPLLFGLGIYIYMSLALVTMAKKTGTPNAWMAWVPIINTFLLLKIANKPMWWFILFIIPFVNIVIAILVFMEVAKRLGKPEWVGALIIVPFINFFIPGYLAWSK